MNDEIIAKIPDSSGSELIFCPDPHQWAFKINAKGIIFNREKYPDSMPDDFAKCFIDILEQNYNVKFEKRIDRTRTKNDR